MKDALPGVAALTDSFADAKYIGGQAVFAQHGTPKDVVVEVNAEIGKDLE